MPDVWLSSWRIGTARPAAGAAGGPFPRTTATDIAATGPPVRALATRESTVRWSAARVGRWAAALVAARQSITASERIVLARMGVVSGGIWVLGGTRAFGGP